MNYSQQQFEENPYIKSECALHQTDEALEIIKNQIELDQSTLVDLVKSDKFRDKVVELNSKATILIAQNKVTIAIIYLNEAERILEYVANLGKQINRQLIVTILHNEACCYQQIWSLEKCSNYVQALIYNINSDLKQLQNKSPTEDNILYYGLNSQMPSQNPLVLVQNIKTKDSLAQYYLLFCALNSQLNSHQSALISSKKSNLIYRNSFKELAIYQHKAKLKFKIQDELKNKQNIIEELAHLRNYFESKDLQSLMIVTRYYYNIWRTKCSFANYKIRRIVDQFRQFSIGNIMQMNSKEFMQIKSDVKSKLGFLPKQYQDENIVTRIICLSISYFTIATQLRLIAKKSYQKFNQSNQYRESQSYHLVAIIIMIKYLPFDIVYTQHIMNSYNNQYGVNLHNLSKEDQQNQSFLSQILFETYQDCDDQKVSTTNQSQKEIQSYQNYKNISEPQTSMRQSQKNSNIHQIIGKAKKSEMNKLNSYFSSPKNQKQLVAQKKMKSKSKFKTKSKNGQNRFSFKSKQGKLSRYHASSKHSTQKTPHLLSPHENSPKNSKNSVKKYKSPQKFNEKKKSQNLNLKNKNNNQNITDQYFNTDKNSYIQNNRHSCKNQEKYYVKGKEKNRDELRTKAHFLTHNKNIQIFTNRKQNGHQGYFNFKSTQKNKKIEKDIKKIISPSKILLKPTISKGKQKQSKQNLYERHYF